MSNPLTSFMRQPKIYIRLPSNGKYWPDGSIDMPDNGELPIYSMTAKDELTLKTPDALLNGQAVVDIIQSCVPNIKNAWVTPNIDLDTLLVALRIATYGEMMEISHTVPGTSEEVTHNIDLRIVLDQVSTCDQWEEKVEVNKDIICYLTPLTYAHISHNSIKTFEAQRIIQLITNDAVSEEDKLKYLNQSVNDLSNIEFEVVSDSVRLIQTPTVEVDDKKFIKEYLQNADKNVFNKIESHLSHMQTLVGIKPLEFESSEEHIKLGAPLTYRMPLNMDYSSFFVSDS